MCVGESLAERDANQVLAVIQRQLAPVLALGAEAVNKMVVAYEPVWAIGTGRTATPEQAQEVPLSLKHICRCPPKERRKTLWVAHNLKKKRKE